jgi:hypothetical protein
LASLKDADLIGLLVSADPGFFSNGVCVLKLYDIFSKSNMDVIYLQKCLALFSVSTIVKMMRERNIFVKKMMLLWDMFVRYSSHGLIKSLKM